ncbi:MAG: hypothetical protein HC826_02710, partial [Rhodospirillales bacterium]|nr:hypothetical protein [Rhodospirillales bacterium]
TALVVLRKIEEECSKRRSAEISVAMPPAVASYILNQKRRTLVSLEDRFEMVIAVTIDDRLVPPDYRIEQLKAVSARSDDAPVEAAEEVSVEETAEPGAERDDTVKKSRRRRGRRRRRPEEETADVENDAVEGTPAAIGGDDESTEDAEDTDDDLATETEGSERDSAVTVDTEETTSEQTKKRRRRGKRGGRRRARRSSDEAQPSDQEGPMAATSDAVLDAFDRLDATDEDVEESADSEHPVALSSAEPNDDFGDGADNPPIETATRRLRRKA